MSELIYPKLSYDIIGAVFEVYNELGYGYQEKIYQKALALNLEKKNIAFKEQVKTDLIYENQVIGKYFLDFLIEDKIILELKIGSYFFKKDYEQIRGYLTANKLELGILILFSKNGVKSKRILCKKNE